jgi:flavin-dependent thymidylate synthase
VLRNLAGPTRRRDQQFDACDVDPANAARMSFEQMDSDRTYEDEMRLNRYLMKNHHDTPFEVIVAWLEFKLPIFVARQFVRHRTQSLNEVSGRYVELPAEWYIPAPRQVKLQTPTRSKAATSLISATREQVLKARASRTSLNDCRYSYDSYLERHRRRDRDGAGAVPSAPEPLHALALDDEPAQPAALPVAARRRARAGRGAGVREGGDRAARPAHPRPHGDVPRVQARRGEGMNSFYNRHAADTEPSGDWMQTYSGGRFYPGDPRIEQIELTDIARALSRICRYAGHCEQFYSVAQHSVYVSGMVPPEHALCALMHDATEAYLVDIPRPLKRMLAGYTVLEDRLWRVIAESSVCRRRCRSA